MVASKNGTAKAAATEIDEAEARAAKIAARKKREALAAAAEAEESAPANTKKAKADETAAKPAKTSTGEVDVKAEAQVLAKQIRSVVYKHFKVLLPTREEQQLKSLAYGAKDKLGRAIARMVAKKNGKMNWELWNNRIFPALFGDLSKTEVKLKYSAETIALAIARLFDGISEEAEEAIKDLIAYNQESFNSRQKPETDDEALEEIDLDLDDEDTLDSDDDDLDDDDE
ncbi:hypothetical protein Cri9333_0386 [Crinalium epipsammum PCC 9333]|uniref:Primosomal protein n=1 Tax=Crinalium epipsammum PCC 9333 TaxID=1173022 RepID=K9VW11_9CYAN|nr:hypothetical protein [Crinalium epipsammum]AFZ11360.1 hypothetical protein Cri9333_0386 [Crinalium epipsammum PCC 9333]